MAAKYKMEILQGEDYIKTITWKTGDPLNPVDLTGYTAKLQIRKKYGSTEVLLELTSGDGITLGGTAGTITLNIPAIDTAAITWLTGVYDLELISAGGIVKRLMYGTVKVSPEVTK